MLQAEDPLLLGGGRLFGVVAVHARLDGLVSSFIAATSLKSLWRSGAGTRGCGDGIGSMDDTFCYVIGSRLDVIVFPALLAASAGVCVCVCVRVLSPCCQESVCVVCCVMCMLSSQADGVWES